jgi:hypothetical protein
LLVDHELRAGRPALGLLNPLLYTLAATTCVLGPESGAMALLSSPSFRPEVYHDVTVGNNFGVR